jgi:hypothetical protein
MASGGDCFTNSAAVNVPAQTITNLGNLSLTGQANSGGNDTFIMAVGSTVYSVRAQILQGAAFNSVGTNWSIVGQRDFNGDGKSGILWRDTVGDVGMWLMNGTQIVQSGSFARSRSTGRSPEPETSMATARPTFSGWTIRGNVGIWFMNGTQILQEGVVGQFPPSVDSSKDDLGRPTLVVHATSFVGSR